MGDAWQVWVDTGGTFTDAAARGPDGEVRRTKVLSSGELRGRVGRVLDRRRFEVMQDWGAGGREGEVRRTKVVSSGELRGRVGRVLDRRRFEVMQDWGEGGVDGLIDGMRVLVMGSARGGGDEDKGRVVSRFDARASAIEVEGELPAGMAPGVPVTVSGDEPAPLLAARILTGTPAPPHPLPWIEMRLATTRGTNALLTRSGARVAFFVTRGFADLLEIGTQQRPDLFALEVVKPRGLHEAVVEVEERIAADGRVLRRLDEDGVRRGAGEMIDRGITCAAVALLHSDRHPSHERRIGELLRGAGFRHVSLSSEVSPFIKILPRAQTAVVDAYLAPVIENYVEGIEGRLNGEGLSGEAPESRATLRLLTSAGGLVSAAGFRGKDSLLSGPAGGVIAARAAAIRSGVRKAISFDMGGTSTDVARLDIGQGGGHGTGIDYVYEHTVGDATLVAPAVAVESVAAGGGSVCGFDGTRLYVGPRSAGASPGPACYGMGGPLTLTDVNLLLGRLDGARLPIPVSEEPARAALGKVRQAMANPPPPGAMELADDALLAGFLEIASERMAGAIRRVSSRAGYDPREYALVCFGGAGGQHACAVAERLGITRVVVPRDTGVLSAMGLGAARVERFAERQVLRALQEVGGGGGLRGIVAALEADAISAVSAEEPGTAASVLRRIAAMRLAGQESTLEIDVANARDTARLFEERYRAVYGHTPVHSTKSGGSRGIEVVWVRVVAGAAEQPSRPTEPALATGMSTPNDVSQRSAWFGGSRRQVDVFQRDGLPLGAVVAGPALVHEQHSAVVVEPGWRAEVDAAGALVLIGATPAQARARGEKEEGIEAGGIEASRRGGPALDEVRLEVLASRLESVAKEMGESLCRTAVSTNVKERLDYSCALLDADGELIVNAPHVPVHLGSLGLCVRSVREAIEIGPGDAVVTNHPAFGGSHLPDITVITAIHGPSGRLLGYAASRAHHAEIGGIRPGSMPPAATCLAEEGIVIRPMHLIRAGESRYDDVRAVLRSGPHPTRAIEDNIADLRAEAAANQRACAALDELARLEGEEGIRSAMAAIKDRGERAIRRALAGMPRRRLVAEETMDDGSMLRAAVEILGDTATIDFTGSAGVHHGNLNATPAIVRSAVMYVLRLLVKEELPLNEGLMRAVEVLLPRGMLNPDFGDDPLGAPAVAGGNVETSQRLVDTLLKALGVCACSQGTMNNVLFGNQRYSYYETVCGGCGAGPGFHGASAVHSHMTNTRITDPEILETRCPVRLVRFAVRRGSGGEGKWRGGDGVLREITFLEPASVSVLSQHRREGPYGSAEGGAGAPGRQRIARAAGPAVELGAVTGVEVLAGDRLILETPGGGGWGAV